MATNGNQKQTILHYTVNKMTGIKNTNLHKIYTFLCHLLKVSTILRLYGYAVNLKVYVVMR